ncbi:MAG: hypothetical protein KGO49_01215 [Gammaproteobacteria bacterium]|nr:hypothetical protein [Gammaproteobacteria bacterium]
MSIDRQHQVVPLAEAFSYHVRGELDAISYHVRGEVDAISYHSEPKGNRTTYIVAGCTTFALTLADIGSLRPNEGEIVEFDVHGLSLWDELL